MIKNISLKELLKFIVSISLVYPFFDPSSMFPYPFFDVSSMSEGLETRE